MSFRSIARFMDSADPARSLRTLLAQHDTVPPVNSLAALERRHQHPDATREGFLVFNTFLMDIPGDGRKPAVEDRDDEIAQHVSERGYGIACLQEVWHREERVDLLDALDFEPHVAHRSGGAGLTNAVPMLGSAGLVTISRSLPIAADNSHTYSSESGDDKFAAKGCLLTVHEIGENSRGSMSSLNVYSTHLNASGDAKYDQILELASFIWSTKDRVGGDLDRPGRPGINASIVAGDFNLDRHASDASRLDTAAYAERARGYHLPDLVHHAITHDVRPDGTIGDERIALKTGFRLLSNILAALGFRDLWAVRNGTPGYTSDLMHPGVIGAIAQPASDDPALCEDRIDDGSLVGLPSVPVAIDHIFVTPSTEGMAFTIDFTRPRRPRTVRPDGAPDRDEISFMSDHLGMTTTVLVAPK